VRIRDEVEVPDGMLRHADLRRDRYDAVAVGQIETAAAFAAAQICDPWS